MRLRVLEAVRARRTAFAVAALAAVPAAARGEGPVAGPPPAGAIDVVLAPVRFEGSFPVTIRVPGNPVSGTLQVDTDVRGRLRGTLSVGARSFDVTGRASHGRKGTHASFKAVSGADRIEFAGDLDGTTLSGRATGRGALAKGRHDFTLDLAAAPPLTAVLEYVVTVAKNGRMKGEGHVIADGEVLDVKVSGASGRRSVRLDFRQGRSFSFAGRGAAGGTSLDWSVRGFGAKTRGEDVAVEVLVAPAGLAYAPGVHEFETLAPIEPLEPRATTALRGTFTVDPPLPPGLSVDLATGVVAGTTAEIRDTASYTVTCTNYAGSASAPVSIRTRIPRAHSFAPETRPLTDDDLRHLLARTQFGVTPAALAKLKSGGVDAYLSAMFEFRMDGPAESVAAPELANEGDPPGLEGQFPSGTQLARWWSSLMVRTDNPFQERLAFFWSDLFAVSTDVLDGGETHFMREYVDLFRRDGAGNLRGLLLSMARSPAMLKYLDGYRNTASRPNENFAREFWELFTLGVDRGYTQEDIVEASRAFTGWKLVTDRDTGYVTASFDASRHDAKSKSVLGHVIPAQSATDDFQAVVDLTLDHREAAEFLTTKLFEHFVREAPPDALVAEMAAFLRANDHEVAPFLDRLFRSEAFYAAASRRALVKSPVDFGVGFVRETGLVIPPSTLTSQLTTLGQRPTDPPTVNGWPQGALWFSAQGMADRMNLVYQCVEATTAQRSEGIEVADVLPPVEQRTAEAVADRLSELLGVPLNEAERAACVAYLNSRRNSDGTTQVSAFDGANQAHLDERVRGLIYVLAAHPAYQVR